jgi:hypothetical protein
LKTGVANGIELTLFIHACSFRGSKFAPGSSWSQSFLPGFLFMTITAFPRMHPYQHVYFNKISNINNPEHRFHFELDYWGLTFRKATERILIDNPSPIINISYSNRAGINGLKILGEADRNRIDVTDSAGCDYYITNYRFRDKEITGLECVDSIYVNGLVISKTFLCRPEP